MKKPFPAYFALDRGTPVLASHIAPTELPAGLSLSIGTTQGLVRYEMPLSEYRRKLLAALAATAISVIEAPEHRSPSGALRRHAGTVVALGALALAVAGALAVDAISALARSLPRPDQLTPLGFRVASGSRR